MLHYAHLLTPRAEHSGWHGKALAVRLLQSFNYLLSTFSVLDTVPSIASKAVHEKGESAQWSSHLDEETGHPQETSSQIRQRSSGPSHSGSESCCVLPRRNKATERQSWEIPENAKGLTFFR